MSKGSKRRLEDTEAVNRNWPWNCAHDFDNAIRKGRAHYLCPKCKQDITLELVMLVDCMGTPMDDMR